LNVLFKYETYQLCSNFMAGRETVTGLERQLVGGVGYLRRAGETKAPTLVLLHGIGSNAESFSALAFAMPAAINVIAWDAPGYGNSMALSIATPTPRHYADALATFLDVLQMQQTALVGHSLGALLAGSFAAHYPDRVSALALISPALGYGVEPGTTLPPGVQSRIDEMNALGPEAFARKRAARLVGDAKARPNIVAAVERAMAAVHPRGYVQAVHALGAGRLLSDAKRIQAPALVAVGARDVITPPDNAKTLYAALPHKAGFYEIADAGHALPQEEPSVVARLLARTLDAAHV
jgi:pimeloyl-ACP methyl ester carboxylesterase